jgi:hypothetical protein
MPRSSKQSRQRAAFKRNTNRRQDLERRERLSELERAKAELDGYQVVRVGPCEAGGWLAEAYRLGPDDAWTINYPSGGERRYGAPAEIRRYMTKQLKARGEWE